MPLLRGNVIGYDVTRMTFQFTMLTPDAMTVSCTVSSTALDFLAGQKGTCPTERKGQFLRLRDAIEQVASNMFDTTGATPVRIFVKHVDRGQKSRGLL